ncbi:hypothetical protein DID88_002653 [Monilinia fructigena]|uniref:Uncharacterized protein n=1 Tax=Monilinia fructigena TaxID=38457 RepID=A0A395IUZ8_9HELO|nr:hypothetical protein DID88_002653 [Monilinia fructigena]
MIKIANDGRFDMVISNMKKVNWMERYKEWQTLALGSGSKQSLSARYGKEKLGESQFFCDLSSGCSVKPDPRRVLEFVNSSLPSLSQKDKMDEARARYWAGMTYWIVFRTGSNTMRSLERGQAYLSSSINSIILDFTKQDDAKAQLICDIANWFIGQIWSKTITGFETFFGQEQYSEKNWLKYLKKWKLSVVSGLLKEIFETGLKNKYDYIYAEEHPGGQVTDSPNFLRLSSQSYTDDLICGQIDGIKGTGGDNLWRMADSGYHLSEIMKSYLQNLSKVYRILNGLESSPDFIYTMSDWMANSNFEDNIHSLDTINIAKDADEWGQKLKGYFISAALAANKCYMKCQSGMNPREVVSRCRYEAFAKHRYCPAEAPDTMCQVNCYTMMDAGNHEKPLIGLEKLQKHGFNSTEVMESSWAQYIKTSNRERKPELTVESGKDAKLNPEKPSLILSTSVSRTNIISDEPAKSKNFPCYTGGWQGLEVESFMDRQGLGRGSPDFGDPKKKNPRAWEVLQNHCPEEARSMPPLTRYFNMICGLRLYWPGKSLRTGLIHNQVLTPDYEGKNDDRCDALRAKTEALDERTANVRFCLGSYPEAEEIFAHERPSVYTDYNDPLHRGNWLVLLEQSRNVLQMVSGKSTNQLQN